MTKGKRYIVYPEGALSWEEIKETFDLLKDEGTNPKIVKYKGLWNVEAGAAKREKGFLIGWEKCKDCGAKLDNGKDPDGFFHTSCNYRIWLEEKEVSE